MAEVRCQDGKLFLHVAIDRTLKSAYADLRPEAKRPVATRMLGILIEAAPAASIPC